MQNNSGSVERIRYATMQSVKCEPSVYGKRTARAAGFSLGLDVDSEDGQDDGQEGDCDVDADVDLDQGSSDDENHAAAAAMANSGAAGCSAAAGANSSAGIALAGSAVGANKKVPPPNGKKTKGRVKIKMEFIDNKLRRYTTFSKRKTGIMKKAYELSTLTGTQVMLLVASETGHVYTFATRKLQPMITSDAGKVLIQTCLNSPDPPVGPSHQPDQRMSATGFEETDLSYTIGDEEGGPTKGDRTPPAYHDQTLTVSQHHHHHHHHQQQQQHQQHVATTVAVSGLVGVRVPSPTPTKGVSVQLPSGFTTILSQGSVMIPPGGHGATAATTTSTPTTTATANVTASGTVMYQTTQGLVYTTPTTGTIPEGVIFNFGQIAQEQGGNGGTQQQFITIPVSLTSTPQRHKN